MNQNDPAIAALSDGGFVITWQSFYQDGPDYGVYAQRYKSSGETYGSEFRVNTYVKSNQEAPAVSGLSDGGFVITWQSYGQDGSDYGIYAQRYTSSSDCYGSEFQVNTYTTKAQLYPVVTGLSDGGFVIAWQSEDQDGEGYGIYAQRYMASGESYSSEFRVNTYVDDDQEAPAIAGLVDGGFLIAWQSYHQDSYYNGIYAQRYTLSGQNYGLEFLVNTCTDHNQEAPSIAGLADGGFVIAWQSEYQEDSSSSFGIYAQRYTSANVPYGFEFHVNTYTTWDQEASAVSGLSDGGFVVTWESWDQDGYYDGVYAQRYTLSSEPYGSEFQVNTYTDERQDSPAVSGLSDGGFVITWASNYQEGENYEIYGKRFSADSYEEIQKQTELTDAKSSSNNSSIITAITIPVGVLALASCAFYFRAKKTANLSDTQATFYSQPLLSKSSQNNKFLEKHQNFSL